MGKRYPLKAVRTLKEKKKRVEEKKFIPFRENLLGSRRLFPGSDEIFEPSAISEPNGKPLKAGAYHQKLVGTQEGQTWNVLCARKRSVGEEHFVVSLFI